MEYVAGFVVWLVVALIAAFVVRTLFRQPNTVAALTFIFGILGAFVGGMLGTSAYIFHDASPLRLGGILGAILGSTFFCSLYHFIARKAV